MNTNHFWEPSTSTVEKSNIFKMMQKRGFQTYNDFWKWSATNKEDFWKETIENLGIKFEQNFKKILHVTDSIEKAKWLYGAKMNIVDSCFQNTEDGVAIVFQKKDGQLTEITQKELLHKVNQIANSLVAIDLKPGDKIAINMPMTYEAVAIYLAGIKAGFPVVTIADSFTSAEIAVRLQLTNPKVIFTQDVLERGDKSLPLYEKVKPTTSEKIIVFKIGKDRPKLRENDLFWDAFLLENTDFNTVHGNPDDCITILFSSGTTGAPKGIPWTHITPIKSASDGYYHQNIQKNDVVCWPTNLGWMMGPWLVFSALLNKATIALYYDAPIDEGFGAFVQNAKVSMLGVIPSFVKYWKHSTCMEKFDWNRIACFSSTGEVSNPVDMTYLMNLAGNKPVIEYCGGTEIGGGYVASTVVQKNIPSHFSTQTLGGEFVLLNEEDQVDKTGELFLIPPILGLSNSLLNKDHFDVYYKDTPKYNGQLLRRHGDQLSLLKNGYYKAEGRVDDAMNLGGIKVSSIQLEEVLCQLDFIKECAAVAVAPKGGGPGLLVVYFVENDKSVQPKEQFNQAKERIRKKINPLFKLFDLVKIEALPRTASNKVMRRKLRNDYRHK